MDGDRFLCFFCLFSVLVDDEWRFFIVGDWWCLDVDGDGDEFLLVVLLWVSC